MNKKCLFIGASLTLALLLTENTVQAKGPLRQTLKMANKKSEASTPLTHEDVKNYR